MDGHALLQRGKRRVHACGVECVILSEWAAQEMRDSAPLTMRYLELQQLNHLIDCALMTSPRA